MCVCVCVSEREREIIVKSSFPFKSRRKETNVTEQTGIITINK